MMGPLFTDDDFNPVDPVSSRDEQKGGFPLTAREVRYKSSRMMGAKRWEELRGIFTNRKHLWYLLLEGEEDELFRELSLALIYVALGETQNAKRYLEQILRVSHENARALFLYAYVNLLENNGEEALVRYTHLLDHKEFRSHVQRILAAVKNESSAYKLTLSKPLAFFYTHYKRTWGDAFYYYGRSFLRKLKSPLYWIGLVLIIAILWGASLWINATSGGTSSKIQDWLRGTLYWGNLPSVAEAEQNFEDITLNARELQATTPKAFNPAYYEKHFQDMKRAIGSGAANEAISIYNGVMGQNPPFVLSERFAILKGFVPIPQITSFENTISFVDMMKDPPMYVDTYWKFQGEVLAPRKFDILSDAPNSQSLTRVLTADNPNIVFSLVVSEGLTGREIVEVFFEATDVFPREGEHYEILMSFIGLGKRERPYMLGRVMRRLKK